MTANACATEALNIRPIQTAILFRQCRTIAMTGPANMVSMGKHGLNSSGCNVNSYNDS